MPAIFNDGIYLQETLAFKPKYIQIAFGFLPVVSNCIKLYPILRHLRFEPSCHCQVAEGVPDAPHMWKGGSQQICRLSSLKR